MKRLLLAVFFLSFLILPASAGDKANTVLIHPSETIYARFETKGKKLKLISYSKVKDDAAQVIFSIGPDAKKPDKLVILKVENKLPGDLLYKVEIRSLSKKMQLILPVAPVVAGKLAFEDFPKQLEEVAAYDFQMEK